MPLAAAGAQAGLVELANQVFGMDVRYEVISDEENITELMKDPKIAARGEKVAKMLTGCFQAVRTGAGRMAGSGSLGAGCRTATSGANGVRWTS